MFSNIPLPKVVADTGPGGGIPTGLGALNALSNQNLNNKILGVQAQYAPLTTQAEAMSKLAYANLMGPQFLSKLMGNTAILANTPDDQKREILQRLQAAGTGQGTGANLFSQLLQNSQPAQNENPLMSLFKKITGQGNYNNQNAMQQTQPIQPGIENNPYLSPNDPSSQNNVQPMGAASPPQSSMPDNGISPTFAENVGNYEGLTEEGKKAGAIRAQDIKELNDTVLNADTKQTTLDDINDMISSPIIRQIRQLPLAGQHEISYYAKEGTPEQQQVIGRLYSQFGNIVKDSARDFAGQFRKGEQYLLQGMKPNPADTVDVMAGKAESLSVMNKMLRERAALTSQYMSQHHVNKLQALDYADKQLNGDAIRKEIHNKLYPNPGDDDIEYMAKKYNVSKDEIKNRLKAKGLL